MNVRKCGNGHFYDSDAFEFCPHCKEPADNVKKNFEKKNKKHEKSKKEQIIQTTEMNNPSNEKTSVFVCEPTTVLYVNQKENYNDVFDEKINRQIETAKAFFDDTANDELIDEINEEVYDDAAFDIMDDNTAVLLQDEGITNDTIETTDDKISEDSQSDIGDDMDVNAETVPIVEEPNPIIEPQNISETETPMCETPKIDKTIVMSEFDPVIGWLVGISGADRGKSFELYTGRNSVGRSKTFTVNLGGGVSDDADFYIIFDKNNTEYLLSSGVSREIVYVNGSPVFSNCSLNGETAIETSKGKYLFLPFCNESRKWDEI